MEEVEELEAVDNNQFVLVTDTRILDLRAWEPGSLQVKDPIVSYRRMMVRCKSDQPTEAGTPQNLFRFQQSRPDRELEVRYDSIELNPRFRFTGSQLAKGNRGITTEAEFDLSTVLVGKSIEIGFEILSSGLQGKENQLPILQFPIVAETKVASMWVLLPEDKHYDRFELLAFDVDSGNLVKAIEPTYSFRMADRTLFGWMFVDTSDQFLYECLWNYRER